MLLINCRFNRGTIYCTPITAALVRQQLRVPHSIIQEVSIGSPIVVNGVKVTVVEANHCPGAVMMLFEPPGRVPVLHSGDCRLTAKVQEEPVLQALRGRVDLVLDTTYADPAYTFPSQEEVRNCGVLYRSPGG
jgi:DNA cross-link repair 1A protein